MKNKQKKTVREPIITSKYIKEIFRTPSADCSEWFGYYNYDTLNYNQTKMLCNRNLVDGVASKKGMSIELGYYDIPTRKWHHIDYSDSWNWQQGAMMQWLPGKGNENRVIYNLSKDNHLISRIHNIDTGEQRDINWAIYGLTPDGKSSITLDLERSYWCRAYHYQSVAIDQKNGNILESDGVFQVNLENNTVKRIISIYDVIALDPQPDFNIMKHWLEHIMISPDGSRFVFLHRFSPSNNIYQYKTRLCIANIDGSGLQLINGQDKYEWSHFGWASDNTFCIYTYSKGRYSVQKSFMQLKGLGWSGISKIPAKIFFAVLNRTVPRLARMIDKDYNYYQFYNVDESGCYHLDNSISNYSFYQIDGHPSFSEDCNYVLTDTYPDKDCFQNLIVYNKKSKKHLVLSKLFAYYKGNPASCDLHPKLCRNNRFVVVDTAYECKHHMIIYEIDWDSVKKDLGNE